MDAASIAMSVQAHLLDITLCELASVDAAFDAWEPFTSMSPRRLAFQRQSLSLFNLRPCNRPVHIIH